VLHRDLKPANIMIDGKGRVRITDFGLAGLADEIPLSDLKSGTPAYMAPEQKAGREVTIRSDIYALGLPPPSGGRGPVGDSVRSGDIEVGERGGGVKRRRPGADPERSDFKPLGRNTALSGKWLATLSHSPDLQSLAGTDS
jgi:serine/threonine protein kinase